VDPTVTEQAGKAEVHMSTDPQMPLADSKLRLQSGVRAQRFNMPRFHKSEIAKHQLQTSVEIFLSGLDLSSVITLAGAAAGILDVLVKCNGKESFVDYARRVHREHVGYTPKRRAYAHHIDKKLGIIAHKHLARNDPEMIELDLEKQATDALARAICDYVVLYGQDEPFVKAYLEWSWNNTDGPALMKRFERVPTKMRPK
jgi:hypothetical protein